MTNPVWTRKSRLQIAIASALGILAGTQSQAQDTPAQADDDIDEVVVTGTRVAAARASIRWRRSTSCRSEPLAVDRYHRTRRGAVHRRALAQFSAAVDHRRHGSHPPRHAARPRARPDAGAGEQQAPPSVRAGQRERIGRPRFGRRRSQRHSARRDRNGRSAARRRLRAIRLGRHRRRDQPAPARSARRRQRLASPTASTTPTSRPNAAQRHEDDGATTHGVGLGRPAARRRRLPHAVGRISRPRSHEPRRFRQSRAGLAGHLALWRRGRATTSPRYVNAGVPLGGRLEHLRLGRLPEARRRTPPRFRASSTIRATCRLSTRTASCRSSPPTSTTSPPAGACAASSGSWDADVSLVYGSNEVAYGVENSLNTSYGAASQTSFDAGEMNYDQLVFNAGVVRTLRRGLPARRRSTWRSASRRAARATASKRANPLPTIAGPIAARPARVRRAFPAFKPEQRSRRRPRGVQRLCRRRSAADARNSSPASRCAPRTTRTSAPPSPASSPAVSTSPIRSRCAARCPRASARRDCSRNSSPRRRPTSSAACRSKWARSRRLRTWPSRSARSRSMPRSRVNYSLGTVLRFGGFEATDRRLSHRHRRSHRALGKPQHAAGGGADRAVRRDRGAVLHQRRRDQDRGHRSRRALRSGAPRRPANSSSSPPATGTTRKSRRCLPSTSSTTSATGSPRLARRPCCSRASTR